MSMLCTVYAVIYTLYKTVYFFSAQYHDKEIGSQKIK